MQKTNETKTNGSKVVYRGTHDGACKIMTSIAVEACFLAYERGNVAARTHVTVVS